MTPKEKAEALTDKMFARIGGSFSETAYAPLTYKETKLYSSAKKVANEMVTEILTSFVINLTDYQIEYWKEVKQELEKL